MKTNSDLFVDVQGQQKISDNCWYVDSSCSRHMTGERELLLDFVPRRGGYVNFAGDKGGNIFRNR